MLVKSSLSRVILICRSCLDRAINGDSDMVNKNLETMLFLARAISKETVKNPRNIVVLKEIMDNLIKTQDQALDNECAELFKVSKTPESIKACSAAKFILSSERNQVVISVLMSISRISQSCLTDVSIKEAGKDLLCV